MNGDYTIIPSNRIEDTWTSWHQ